VYASISEQKKALGESHECPWLFLFYFEGIEKKMGK
jgi:hypothetical protein